MKLTTVCDFFWLIKVITKVVFVILNFLTQILLEKKWCNLMKF